MILPALSINTFTAKENTIVVICSDNGFHNGTKENLAKYMLCEKSNVVLFLMRLAGQEPQECLLTVNLIDINPSLFEDFSLNASNHTLGTKSILPILFNPNVMWERSGFTSYGKEDSEVRSQYKYIRYLNAT